MLPLPTRANTDLERSVFNLPPQKHAFLSFSSLGDLLANKCWDCLGVRVWGCSEQTLATIVLTMGL